MLKEQLKKEQIAAMKAGDQLKKTVLGGLLAAIKNKELHKRGQLASSMAEAVKLEEASQLHDEEILEVIMGEVKKRKDSIEQFRAGGREDLVQREQQEMAILAIYLPEQASEEDIRREVASAMEQSGAKDIKEMGKVIGLVMVKLKGRADGGLVSKLVKEVLLQP